jgi:hypothetical protein
MVIDLGEKASYVAWRMWFKASGEEILADEPVEMLKNEWDGKKRSTLRNLLSRVPGINFN